MSFLIPCVVTAERGALGINNMKEKIENLISDALKNLGIEAENITLEHPAESKNGDYSTNIALVLFGIFRDDSHNEAYLTLRERLPLSRTPFDIANVFKEELEKNKPKEIEKIGVAGPGFINFYLSREFFANSVKEILDQGEDWGKNKMMNGKKVMVEYTQPNPFKPFHIGHLMSNAIGESISRVVEFSGAKVLRANYQGDVGLHVAKAIWGLTKRPVPESISNGGNALFISNYIGQCYSWASDEYENNETAKEEINAINKKVYDRSDEEINKIYDWGRGITLEAFEEIYKILGTKFDYYFFESEMVPIGEKKVRENVGDVFTESDGAIVFEADKYDPKLHTRVFITSGDIPLYEAKEIGLTMTKFEKEPDMDFSIVTTAIEQGEYMKVVQKAISMMHPELEKKMKHITHGMMRLASGKMSSRKGNVITGESLLRDSMNVVREKVKDREFSLDEKNKIAEDVGVAALKYSILRSSLGSDIVYDFEKSISFDGDSGPYLQYTAVRANAILCKAEEQGLLTTDYLLHTTNIPKEISELEHSLYKFPEIVIRSYNDLEPHHISTYITELASAFNSFYGNTHILNDENSYRSYHLALVQAFYLTMKNGLYLLGIKTPDKM